MDDLKNLSTSVDVAIDPNAGVGGIKAQDHNDLLHDAISKLGRYTGLPYESILEIPSGGLTEGQFSWNQNAMNTTTSFVVSIHNRTMDNNVITPIIALMAKGDVIKFKDYVGRTGLLEYDSYQSTENGEVLELTVTGYVSNENYTYESDENENCFLDLFSQASVSRVYSMNIEENILKLYENGSEVGSEDLSPYNDDTNLSRIVSGSLDDDGMLTVTRDDNTDFEIDLSTLIDGGPFAFKQDGSGYYEIKVPFDGTNLSIQFATYRHGLGYTKYRVSAYLNNPNGWVQTYVTKTSQNSSAEETITLTDDGSAGDFRIYIGDDSTTLRNITTLFITEGVLSGISGVSSGISSLSVFPTSIQSSITGTVKGTF